MTTPTTDRKKPQPILAEATLSGSIITVRALPMLDRNGKPWAGGAVLFACFAGDCFGPDRLAAWLAQNKGIKLATVSGFSLEAAA